MKNLLLFCLLVLSFTHVNAPAPHFRSGVYLHPMRFPITTTHGIYTYRFDVELAGIDRSIKR